MTKPWKPLILTACTFRDNIAWWNSPQFGSVNSVFSVLGQIKPALLVLQHEPRASRSWLEILWIPNRLFFHRFAAGIPNVQLDNTDYMSYI